MPQDAVAAIGGPVDLDHRDQFAISGQRPGVIEDRTHLEVSAALGSDRCAHGIRIVAEVAARPGVDDDPGGHAQKKTDLRCMSRA